MSLEVFGDFGFAGASAGNADSYQDSQRCLNWYPESAVTKESKTAVALIGAPGLIALVTAGPSLPTLGSSWAQPSSVTNLPVRGMWVLPGRLQALAVIGSTCYLVTQIFSIPAAFPSLQLTAVGTLSTSSGPVAIRDNNAGGYAIIVDGPNYYLYNI